MSLMRGWLKIRPWMLVAIWLALFWLAGCTRTGEQPKAEPAAAVSSNTQAPAVPNSPETPSKVPAVNKPPGNNSLAMQQEPAGRPELTAPEKPPETVNKPVLLTISARHGEKVFFSTTFTALAEGETVLSVTRRAADDCGVNLDLQGMGPMAYVAGIGDLREFDEGPMSGWLYRVNGEYPGVGCGMYKLKPGDRVEWVYTKDGKRI